MTSADHSLNHKTNPHPPTEGKPRFQRQFSAKLRRNQRDGEAPLSRPTSRSYGTSTPPLSSSNPLSVHKRPPSNQSSSSSLEGFGLSDDFAKSLPIVAKQDPLYKYEPLPPIQFDQSHQEAERVGYPKSGSLSSEMGRRKSDTNSVPKKSDTTAETESGPSSAKRARSLYRKNAMFTKTRGIENETPDLNVSPWKQGDAESKITRRNSEKFKGHSLHLAFRLLDGERIEKDLMSTETVGNVLAFLTSQITTTQHNNTKKYVLCSHDIPPKEYHELQLTLAEVGIQDRMLLYVTDK